MSHLLLQRGSLGPAIAGRTRHARACGAMRPIETTEEIVTDAGVDFLVRRLSTLERKEQARKRKEQAAGPVNPFLPHEPDLFVADVSDTHFALLNKFNVIERHLLIVTRAFVDQETLLDVGDFEALAACMAEVDGLAFYNGGAGAGARQPAKHPQPASPRLAKTGSPVPVERLLRALGGKTGILRVPGLAFGHAFAWMDYLSFEDVKVAARQMHACYRELLAAAGLRAVQTGDEARQSGPYNLLATPRWMLLVPRRKEHFDSIAVNALGFAGSLFVRDEAQIQVVKRAGPMAVLQGTAIALA